ncbi:MAG TPA: GNAT family N-acetyltransferase [Gammaproteobacteria bacterium]|nr:GNAT family N-acetyltransferase [Gammaproteobacteria bacterium]
MGGRVREIQLRQAVIEDAGLILRFVRELAADERAAAEVTATEADLEDLYVSPDYRRAGAGRALLRHLARTAVSLDCGRMEWNVLDWNEPAIRFYESIGAEPLTEWVGYRLAGEALESFADGT